MRRPTGERLDADCVTLPNEMLKASHSARFAGVEFQQVSTESRAHATLGTVIPMRHSTGSTKSRVPRIRRSLAGHPNRYFNWPSLLRGAGMTNCLIAAGILARPFASIESISQVQNTPKR